MEWGGDEGGQPLRDAGTDRSQLRASECGAEPPLHTHRSRVPEKRMLGKALSCAPQLLVLAGKGSARSLSAFLRLLLNQVDEENLSRFCFSFCFSRKRGREREADTETNQLRF